MGPLALGVLVSVASTSPVLKFGFADPSNWLVWFNQTTTACGLRDTPDQSIAAFRRSDGQVVAYSSDDGRADDGRRGGFYRMVGPSLAEVKRDCKHPVIHGGLDPNAPASVFPHRVWLMAT